jgi:hypothetical protein
MARWHSANVLQAAGDRKRLWQFAIKGQNPNLVREETRLPAEPLPPKLVSKDWQTLYKPRLNIAWLPADKVFLRVVQLPPADTFQETASMVELQLEKVSPLPVAQIVWTFELLPRHEGQLQTAIVIIAARHLVEAFLGRLEGDNYLADRLEVPFIDQLLVTKVNADGVWIFAGVGGDEAHCLVAWWFGGRLQNISLLHLPPVEERASFLSEQIAQMAWAGELEGWITGPPRRFLVTTPELAAIWQPLIQEGTEQTVEVVTPQPDATIAQLTARRAVRENGAVGLVPPEYTARYRQQFVDRIWMRSLFAVVLLYLFGVFIYLAMVQYVDFRVSKVEAETRGVANNYTNAMRLREQVRVMQDQLNLQFAALESYKAVAQQIPEGVTLDGMNFQRGRTIALYGTTTEDSRSKVNEFSDALRRTTSTNGQPLFKNVGVPAITSRGAQINWNFAADLAKGESE